MNQGLNLAPMVFGMCRHQIDEVSGLSLYFTPRSGGRRVEFRGQTGEVVDHIALEPIARKIYTGSATAVKTTIIDRAVAPVDAELRNIVAPRLILLPANREQAGKAEGDKSLSLGGIGLSNTWPSPPKIGFSAPTR